MIGPNGVASYAALGHVPPRLSTISFLVHVGVNLTGKYIVHNWGHNLYRCKL